MTLTYILTPNDFLQHQLFLASKSPGVKNKRKWTWLFSSSILLILGFLFYQSGNHVLAYSFFAVGILYLAFFPFFLKYRYKEYYTTYIMETCKNRFGETAHVTFTDEHIESIDVIGESKINLSQIENVTETGNYFYLQIRAGGHFIIPKHGVQNVEMVRGELKRLCNKLRIDFLEELNWKWK